MASNRKSLAEDKAEEHARKTLCRTLKYVDVLGVFWGGYLRGVVLGFGFFLIIKKKEEESIYRKRKL